MVTSVLPMLCRKALDTQSAPTQQVLEIALNFYIHLLLFSSEGKKIVLLAQKVAGQQAHECHGHEVAAALTSSA